MTNYLDVGVFRDYCRYTEHFTRCFTPDATSFTPVSTLSGDSIPDDPRVQRALALAYAFNGDSCENLNRLLKSNCDDVCFQLYAYLSCKVEDAESYILFSQRATIDELCVVAMAIEERKILKIDPVEYYYGTDEEKINELEVKRAVQREQILFRSESIYALQKAAREFVYNDKSLLMSQQFLTICQLGSYDSKEELSRMWCTCLNGSLKEHSRAARFFWSWGITFTKLLQMIRECSYLDYASLLTSTLFRKCSPWTDSERDSLQALRYISACDPIEHLYNYEWAYKNLRNSVKIDVFAVYVTYTTAIERLQLLRPDDRRRAIAKSFALAGKISNVIQDAFPKETAGIFKSYDRDLLDLWKSMLPNIPFEYDRRYVQEYLCKLDDLSTGIQFIAEDTLPIFCKHLDNPAVIEAVTSWCIEMNKYFLLSDCHEYFDSDVQENICAQASLIAIGRYPDIPVDADVVGIAVPLQPYAIKYGYKFEALNQEQQEFLSKALDLGTVYPEKELVSLTKSCLRKCHDPRVLKYALQYGKSYMRQIAHYFVELDGNELLFEKETVCTPEYVFVKRGQTLEEARYYRGRTFKRTRPISQKFSDATLDFFKWCGTDKYNVTVPKNAKPSDFGKIYVEQCLMIAGCNFDLWPVELLQTFNMMKHFTPECVTIPADVLNAISQPADMEHVVANLNRHPIEWYQQYDGYCDLLLYDFDWDESSVTARDEIFESGASTKNELYLTICRQSGYAYAIDHINKIWK